jgi:hypothetical protein
MWRRAAVGCVVIGLVLGSAVGARAQAWGRPRVPSAGVCFYEDIDFGGRYFCANPGATLDRVPAGTNDRISSIRLFGDVEVSVYRNPGFEGSSRLFTGDVNDLRRAGWNDRISSFIVSAPRNSRPIWSRGSLPQTGVCFYEHANFAGEYFCARLGTNMALVPVGTNDKISSIRLFGRAEVLVFRDAGFQGSSRLFADDIRDLRQAGWNDRISSFRLSTRGFGGGGRGFSTGLQVYADINYRGRSATFLDNTADVGLTGMAGLISSLRVPPGETWQVCTEVNYRGRCQVVSGDVSDLRRGDWNDLIASARRIR